jgi:hypothetical protein
MGANIGLKALREASFKEKSDLLASKPAFTAKPKRGISSSSLKIASPTSASTSAANSPGKPDITTE